MKKTKWVEPGWAADRDEDVRHNGLAAKVRHRITYQTERHRQYAEAIDACHFVFCVGPAGTGKSYIAAAKALESLLDGRAEQVIITRPNVGVGNPKGFLPGGRDDKNRPWFEVMEDHFLVAIGEAYHDVYRDMVKDKRVVFEDLEYMRGRNFRNAVVVIDEAQNCSFAEMRLILTRGYGSTKFLANGDLTQCDVKHSGLREVLRRVRRSPLVEVVQFTPAENMRSAGSREMANLLAKPERRFTGVDVSFWTH